MLNDIILGQDEMNATGTDISTVKQAASVLLNFIWSFLKKPFKNGFNQKYFKSLKDELYWSHKSV